MKQRSQATLKTRASFSGIGVHSGKQARMDIIPAGVGNGIVFKRTDVTDKNNIIALDCDNVVRPIMHTRITNSDLVSVGVIEHVLAALRITGVTNATVEIDSEEVPIMDGSALVFVKSIETVVQDAKVPAIIIKREVRSENITISKADTTEITLTLDYERINKVIGMNNTATFDMSDVYALQEIAAARTFGWLEDCDKMKNAGMALGASLENTIVIDQNNAILNPDGVRSSNELVLHKALDLIGDFMTIGYDIVGKISGYNTSHLQNNLALRELMSNLGSHEVII